MTSMTVSVSQASSAAPGDVAWSNATASVLRDNDGQMATSSPTYSSAPLTEYLTGSGVEQSLPGQGRVMGLILKLRKYHAGGERIRDEHVRLTIDGVASGDDKADQVSDWPTTESLVSYGSETDRWNLPITLHDVASGRLGFAIQARAATSGFFGSTAYVERSVIDVHYRPEQRLWAGTRRGGCWIAVR